MNTEGGLEGVTTLGGVGEKKNNRHLTTNRAREGLGKMMAGLVGRSEKSKE